MKSFNHIWINGLALNVFIFCFGLALHVSQKDILNPSHFSKYTSKYIEVRIIEPLLERKKSYKGLAEVVEVVDSNGISHKCIGKLAIYFQKDSSVISGIHYGDILLLRSNYKEAQPPQNPYEFNYKRYLAFNNIYHQSYLRLGDFIKTGISKKNFLFEFSYTAQQYFKDVLNKYVESKTEVAVSQALLYGYDDDIDADVVKAYSNTGTLHVLAVSGMHVGIIFWIISKLLIFLDKKRWGKILKAIISIVLLWIYSLLCGFSPSILRATVMFSFMIVGKLFKRDVNIYNTLATSAFVILIFDTNIIANVGFQLSYLAVLGIVTFQKTIYNWYQPKYWLVDQIWSITAVSIAAQIATFPVGLQLLSDIEKNNIDKVLVWEMSRLGRNLVEVLSTIEIFNNRKISLFIKNHNLETLNEDKSPNPLSMFMVQILSAVAQMERLHIKQRMNSGYKYYISNGGKVGREKGKKEDKKEFLEKHSEIVKLLKKGISIRNISKLTGNKSSATIIKVKKLL